MSIRNSESQYRYSYDLTMIKAEIITEFNIFDFSITVNMKNNNLKKINEYLKIRKSVLVLAWSANDKCRKLGHRN
jgi:histidyl-tRNA synthetase